MSRLEKGLRFSDQLPLVIVGCAFALAVGIGLGAYFMRSYDKKHPIAH